MERNYSCWGTSSQSLMQHHSVFVLHFHSVSLWKKTLEVCKGVFSGEANSDASLGVCRERGALKSTPSLGAAVSFYQILDSGTADTKKNRQEIWSLYLHYEKRKKKKANMFHQAKKMPQTPLSFPFQKTITRDSKFPLEGWMSAIFSDFAPNLGNVCEHVFFLFLIPSLLAVLWLSTVTT